MSTIAAGVRTTKELGPAPLNAPHKRWTRFILPISLRWGCSAVVRPELAWLRPPVRIVLVAAGRAPNVENVGLKEASPVEENH